MTTQNLLVELFVEELPPKALKKLGDAFAGVLATSLRAQGLATEASVVTAYASPRRLAAHVTAVAAQAADKAVAQKLMPVSVGLDASGAATPALLKKLLGLNLDASAVPQLQRRPDGQGRSALLRQPGHRRHAHRRLAEGARRSDREIADPEGHAVPARRRPGAACTSCARRTAWWHCTATMS